MTIVADLTLDDHETATVKFGDHHVQIAHVVHDDGTHGISIAGVNVNLEGEMPGLYYFAQPDSTELSALKVDV